MSGKLEMSHVGRMNDPTASAYVKGLCGDEMEFYMIIENDIISKILFYPNGCQNTMICGEVTACIAEGQNIYDALNISARDILDKTQDLEIESKHCAILATITLYKAIADYMLKV